jgi:hypothetical protein
MQQWNPRSQPRDLGHPAGQSFSATSEVVPFQNELRLSPQQKPKLWAAGESQVSKTARPGAPGFYDFVVFTEKKRVEKLRYMHRNPVVRGLVLAPEEWNWSSFRHYALGKQGPVLVNEAQKAEMRVRGIA